MGVRHAVVLAIVLSCAFWITHYELCNTKLHECNDAQYPVGPEKRSQGQSGFGTSRNYREWYECCSTNAYPPTCILAPTFNKLQRLQAASSPPSSTFITYIMSFFSSSSFPISHMSHSTDFVDLFSYMGVSVSSMAEWCQSSPEWSTSGYILFTYILFAIALLTIALFRHSI